jgi:predicted short-subunit dehydrogenase-like oxidoreductase (DUF2520 family)
VTRFRVIGPGRAGRSLLAALSAVGGYEAAGVLGRCDPSAGAANGVDLLVIATPDDAVAEVAAAVDVVATTAVVHLSGSLGLDVLAPHPRRGSVHPLVPLPSAEIGAARLASGVTFAVAGDPVTRSLVESLGGHAVEVDDDRRGAYHAAATVAANHLVALLGQVERLAALAGLPLDAFAGLVSAAADDAFALGPAPALTGPAARGDWRTLERHRGVIAELASRRSDLAAYDAMVGLARRLALDARVTEAAGSARAALGARANEGAATEQVA